MRWPSSFPNRGRRSDKAREGTRRRRGHRGGASPSPARCGVRRAARHLIAGSRQASSLVRWGSGRATRRDRWACSRSKGQTSMTSPIVDFGASSESGGARVDSVDRRARTCREQCGLGEGHASPQGDGQGGPRRLGARRSPGGRAHAMLGVSGPAQTGLRNGTAVGVDGAGGRTWEVPTWTRAREGAGAAVRT